MKKNDFILVVAVLFLAALLLLCIPNKSADIAKITVDGKLFATVPLNRDRVIDINGTNTVVIENGEIYMQSANCPDKLCIHQGRISDSSKKIICLPNKIIIEATKESNLDTVVR